MITNETFDHDIPENEKTPECDNYGLDECFGTLDDSQFAEVLKEMNSLYQKKNSDYGSSFDKLCNEFGLTAAIIRLSDKLERIKSINQSQSQKVDEKIEDTLLDLANYAVMTLVWLRNEKSV